MNKAYWILAFEIIVPGATLILIGYAAWKLYRLSKVEE